VKATVHDLSESERACAGCGKERVAIGREKNCRLESNPGVGLAVGHAGGLRGLAVPHWLPLPCARLIQVSILSAALLLLAGIPSSPQDDRCGTCQGQRQRRRRVRQMRRLGHRRLHQDPRAGEGRGLRSVRRLGRERVHRKTGEREGEQTVRPLRRLGSRARAGRRGPRQNAETARKAKEEADRKAKDEAERTLKIALERALEEEKRLAEKQAKDSRTQAELATGQQLISALRQRLHTLNLAGLPTARSSASCPASAAGWRRRSSPRARRTPLRSISERVRRQARRRSHVGIRRIQKPPDPSAKSALQLPVPDDADFGVLSPRGERVSRLVASPRGEGRTEVRRRPESSLPPCLARAEESGTEADESAHRAGKDAKVDFGIWLAVRPIETLRKLVDGGSGPRALESGPRPPENLTPAQSRIINERIRESIRKMDDQANKIRGETVGELIQELDKLRDAGLWKTGDDFVRKNTFDAAFRKAVDDARDRVLLRQDEKLLDYLKAARGRREGCRDEDPPGQIEPSLLPQDRNLSCILDSD